MLSQREIANFYEDMDALGIMRADLEPKATEHITDIISLIQELISRGAAYESQGDVYFSVRSFHGYGELSRRNIDEMIAGARVAPHARKRSPADFALWKAARPGEPSWESPWGDGRPGWHIECSAMSMKYLGETLDIHGGGLDLIFPHHENERAQSEAATGRDFVKCWMHNGFVTIKGDKMSKSLNNFVTIRDILHRYHPEALRLFLLSKHYRSPLDYSADAISENAAALDRCYNTLSEAMNLLSRPVKKRRPLTEKASVAIKELEALVQKFNQAMDDDFNTAMAAGSLFEAVRALNRLIDEAALKPSALYAAPLEKGVADILGTAAVLGILQHDAGEYLRQRNLRALSDAGIDERKLLELIETRNVARKEKNWAEADRIRNELLAKKIVLRDDPKGTSWTAARP